MITELRQLLQLDELKLNYDVKIADFDGENFIYSITECDCDTASLLVKLKDALEDLQEDVDCGYIDIYGEDKIEVFQDTGSVADPLKAVHRLLYALNEVEDVKAVIINP